MSYRHTESFFFFVMRTFKIYSFSNFQVLHTAVLPIVIILYMHYILNTYLSFNWQFVPFDHLHLIHSPPLPFW